MAEDPSRNASVTAGCALCGGALPAGRPRRWCSDACRQAAHRRRHGPPAEAVILPPTRSRRDGTIYECPSCEQRFVGVQRCDDCNVWARRLGRGGRCPHCDEAVTHDELQELSD